MGRDEGCARKELTADDFSSFKAAGKARDRDGTHGQVSKRIDMVRSQLCHCLTISLHVADKARMTVPSAGYYYLSKSIGCCSESPLCLGDVWLGSRRLISFCGVTKPCVTQSPETGIPLGHRLLAAHFKCLQLACLERLSSSHPRDGATAPARTNSMSQAIRGFANTPGQASTSRLGPPPHVHDVR
jgi:hypothetical protein